MFTKQPLQSYANVTALSLSLCIQELMLEHPRDVSLCSVCVTATSTQFKKKIEKKDNSGVGLECLSIHRGRCFVINVLALHDGKISYI